MQDCPVIYRVIPDNLHAHWFRVDCTIAAPNPSGQVLSLPAWIPGSYLIRDFARHVLSVTAVTKSGKALRIRKIDKHTWRADPCAESITVTATLYAWDSSVRGAHLDTTHGFFNGSSLLLRVHGQDACPHQLEICPPAGATYADWQVTTSLRPAAGLDRGFGVYHADSYEELIDHPVEMGRQTIYRFMAAGVPHTLAIRGRHEVDADRLLADLTRLCQHHIDFFGQPAPFENYVFLLNVVGDGYGGLEHRAATALSASRSGLPAPGPQGRGNSPVAKTDDYVSLLGLFSHEYFHAWHVKRIRPAAHINADLSSESYTRLLWVFEGITSYYDDLALVRSGLIDAKVYLGLLAQSITRLWRTGGRRHQSLVESSFDAWIKFYKADENASNSQVSYYGKGALVALALDLSLRAQSSGQISLDMVMKALWHRYGQTGVGLPEDGLEGLVEELAGPSMAGFFDHYVYGTQDPPLKALLGAVGVILAEAPAKSPDDLGGYGDGTAAENWPRVWLGAKYAATDGGLKLQQVYEGGSAQVAGLVPGDIIVAIDGWRCDNKVLQAWQKSAAVGSQVALHAFRGNELLNITLAALAAPMDTCYLSLVAEASQDVFQAREAWLQSLSNL